MNDLWTTITCQQRPLFLGPKGGRCTQVWLYLKCWWKRLLSLLRTLFFVFQSAKNASDWTYQTKQTLGNLWQTCLWPCHTLLLFLSKRYKRISSWRAAFTSADPENAKKTDNLTVFFALSSIKAHVEHWWNQPRSRSFIE